MTKLENHIERLKLEREIYEFVRSLYAGFGDPIKLVYIGRRFNGTAKRLGTSVKDILDNSRYLHSCNRQGAGFVLPTEVFYADIPDSEARRIRFNQWGLNTDPLKSEMPAVAPFEEMPAKRTDMASKIILSVEAAGGSVSLSRLKETMLEAGIDIASIKAELAQMINDDMITIKGEAPNHVVALNTSLNL